MELSLEDDLSKNNLLISSYSYGKGFLKPFSETLNRSFLLANDENSPFSSASVFDSAKQSSGVLEKNCYTNSLNKRNSQTLLFKLPNFSNHFFSSESSFETTLISNNHQFYHPWLMPSLDFFLPPFKYDPLRLFPDLKYKGPSINFLSQNNLYNDSKLNPNAVSSYEIFYRDCYGFSSNRRNSVYQRNDGEFKSVWSLIFGLDSDFFTFSYEQHQYFSSDASHQLTEIELNLCNSILPYANSFRDLLAFLNTLKTHFYNKNTLNNSFGKVFFLAYISSFEEVFDALLHCAYNFHINNDINGLVDFVDPTGSGGICMDLLVKLNEQVQNKLETKNFKEENLISLTFGFYKNCLRSGTIFEIKVFTNFCNNFFTFFFNEFRNKSLHSLLLFSDTSLNLIQVTCEMIGLNHIGMLFKELRFFSNIMKKYPEIFTLLTSKIAYQRLPFNLSFVLSEEKFITNFEIWKEWAHQLDESLETKNAINLQNQSEIFPYFKISHESISSSFKKAKSDIKILNYKINYSKDAGQKHSFFFNTYVNLFGFTKKNNKNTLSDEAEFIEDYSESISYNVLINSISTPIIVLHNTVFRLMIKNIYISKKLKNDVDTLNKYILLSDGTFVKELYNKLYSLLYESAFNNGEKESDKLLKHVWPPSHSAFQSLLTPIISSEIPVSFVLNNELNTSRIGDQNKDKLSNNFCSNDLRYKFTKDSLYAFDFFRIAMTEEDSVFMCLLEQNKGATIGIRKFNKLCENINGQLIRCLRMRMALDYITRRRVKAYKSYSKSYNLKNNKMEKIIIECKHFISVLSENFGDFVIATNIELFSERLQNYLKVLEKQPLSTEFNIHEEKLPTLYKLNSLIMEMLHSISDGLFVSESDVCISLNHLLESVFNAILNFVEWCNIGDMSISSNVNPNKIELDTLYKEFTDGRNAFINKLQQITDSTYAKQSYSMLVLLLDYRNDPA